MSVKLMAAAWDLDIGSTEKMVLMCLCDFASDGGGNCWPSIATLARKCSKSERTVQGSIRWLEEHGYLKTHDQLGKRRDYTLDPRRICTPAKAAPVQKKTKTPAESAPKPPLTTKIKNTQRAHVMPEGWEPTDFGPNSKCREIAGQWTAGEFAGHLEHFTKHHRSKGSRFINWQDAWETWVLNSRKWGPRPSRGTGPPSNDPGGYLDHYLAKQARRSSG